MNNVDNAMDIFPLTSKNYESYPLETTNTDFDIKNDVKIENGLCNNCDYIDNCVFQHDNKLYCEHFK